MWVAIGVVAVVVLMIAALLRAPRPSDDGPLPPELEAQVLLGEDPDAAPDDGDAIDEDEMGR